MKRFIAVLTAVTALVIFGCEILLGPDEPAGTGALSIGFGGSGGGGRASVPTAEELAALRYELVLTGPGGQNIEVSVSAGEGYDGQVALGEWHIAAEAYNPENVLIGTGTAAVTVRAGMNHVQVPMRMVPREDTPVAVTGVSLNKTATTILVGGTETLTAAVTPANAANKTVTWTSDNTAAATVNNGVVTGVAEGTAAITVTTEDGGFMAACTVTVRSTTVTAQYLSAALNAVTPGSASASGDTVTLLADISLVNTTITVPAGVTLDLAANHKSLTLGNDAVLTVNGVVNAEAAYDSAAAPLSGNGGLVVESAAESPATIKGTGVIHLKSPGILLTLIAGTELTLEGDVVLDGLMTAAAAATAGITLSADYADGSDNDLSCVVYIFKDAVFTMEGGVIGYNKGPGIFTGGVFNMSGGTITGNYNPGGASGGIYVGYKSVFTMSGGEIKDNHADLGGGVYVTQGTDSTGTYQGVFIMAGGTVYGNAAGSGLANTASSYGAALYTPFADAYWGDKTTPIPNKTSQNGTLRGGTPKGTVDP